MIQECLPVSMSGTESFRTFLKNIDSGTTRAHHHPSYELNFVLKGEGTRYVGSRQDYFEEGDLILLAPGISHNWAYKKSKSASYSSFVIQWDEGFMNRMCSVAPEFGHIRKLLNLSLKGLVLNKDFGKEMKKYKYDLLNLPSFEKLLLLLQMLNEFSKSKEFEVLSEEGFYPRKNIPNSRLEKVHQFVEENYSEKITLKMISSIVNMSEGAFSRFFSQTFKKPFFSYLNEFRIHKSYQFLEETDLRINEIGYACGYDCLQFFYRQFMKYSKCAPQDYRTKFISERG
ncbi:MAG TPA: AraC family transcriptional regulator [Niabella sp.]|nr:AraC family transcriptional regulator [Niabella sp.]HOZ95739.1 AraC family transcriptional regulator [Niabella sp.]HQW15982.1 AraC family transcriptional regulator [Niabella sp.]HQX21165.1 AraC family transcriptional regulator [Niabella sp.]HQX40744.1 AraC family transcriptional regulator [Niabella sp.]